MRLETVLKALWNYVIDNEIVLHREIGSKGELILAVDLGEDIPHVLRIHVVGENAECSKQGIHTFPEDYADVEYRLENAFEQVGRDYWNDIYIHVEGV